MKISDRVGILNHNVDVINSITEVLMEQGITVFSAYLPTISERREMIEAFLDDNHLQALLYDVPPPYEINYNFFKQHVEPYARERKIRLVLMTTNLTELERIVGDSGAYELLGKPFDIKEIVDALKGTKPASV